MTARPLTGTHVLMMFVAGFGCIIAVNAALAVSAVRTFPGLEVANSYVASQSFDARRTAQEALGWQMRVRHADGLLRVELTDRTGDPAPAEGLVVWVGRPTEARDDVQVVPGPDGAAPLALAPGRWRVLVQATGPGGRLFERRTTLRVLP